MQTKTRIMTITQHNSVLHAFSVPNWSEICGVVDVLTVPRLSPTGKFRSIYAKVWCTLSIGNTKNDHVATPTCLEWQLKYVQRRAARFVSGQHDGAVSVTGIMAGLGWRSLQERRLESRLCMLYKTIKGTSACNIPAYIHPHSTSLRASHDQQYRVPHTTNPIDAYTYSFFPRTIRIWNILPAALVHASTIEGFKNGLHKEFLSGNMYVVSPRGQYDRPRLGSSASLPVVGPVY